MTIVNEAGLYTLILGSRKPEAKAFKRWVTHEVLPSIRKTGRYEANPERTPEDPLPFDRLAEESLPFRKVHPGLYAELRRTSKALAQAYLLECGVTPDYVSARLEELHGAPPASLAHADNEQREAVNRLWEAWRSGALGVAVAPCLSVDLYHCYSYRCQAEGITPFDHGRFISQFKACSGGDVRLLRYGQDKRHVKQARIFIPQGAVIPAVGHREWLHEAITAFQRMVESMNRSH